VPTLDSGLTIPPEPAGKPISLSGSGSKKTKPFVMFTPARVDLTFSGSGNFITEFKPVGGDALSGVSLSNTIGRTKLTTYVYDPDLNGTKVYADLIASSGKWTIKITPIVLSPATAPVSFTDQWGLRTSTVHLSGDFTVTYSHRGGGNFIVELTPVGGNFFDGESISNEIGKVSSSTEVYGLDGDYYFDVTADGVWKISITPQA
jgi:hypothetical protein